MPLSREIQNMIDDYADGKLSDDEVRKLASLLKESEEVRKQLALAAVVERLLRALGKGAVPVTSIMSKVREVSGKPETAAPVTQPRQRITAPGIIKSPVIRRAGRGREPRSYARIIAFVSITAVMVFASTVMWKKWQGYKDPSSNTDPDKPSTTSTTIQPDTIIAENNNTSSSKPDPGTNYNPIARALAPFITEDLPPRPADEDLSPPVGNGENEPGFVPPPKEWLLAAQEHGTGENIASEHPGKPLAPVLCTKIKHGNFQEWAVTPKDIPSLLNKMEHNIGVRYGMNIKEFCEIDTDPTDNPILFFTGHYNFVLKQSERAALRKFIIRGGMVIFNAGLGSKPFYNSAMREIRLILPELPVKRLGADHPIFHARHDLYDINYCKAVRDSGYFERIPWLEGVTLSCRTAAVISRWDMAAGWEDKEDESFLAYRAKDAQRLGVNLMTYGASIRAWVKRSLPSYKFEEINTGGTDAMLIAQIQYNGEWRTRYAGLTILLHSFNRRTEVPVKLGIKPMRLTDDGLFNVPLIYITGHESITLDKQEGESLKKYITNGGFLFAEACCGRKGFDKDFRKLMAELFPESPLQGIPVSDDIFKMPNKIELLGVTPALGTTYGSMLIPPGLEGIQMDGHYAVIYSPYGLAGSWEATQTPYACGYEDPDTLKLGQNILMYAITQ